jgi:hypothetical protein
MGDDFMVAKDKLEISYTIKGFGKIIITFIFSIVPW